MPTRFTYVRYFRTHLLALLLALLLLMGACGGGAAPPETSAEAQTEEAFTSAPALEPEPLLEGEVRNGISWRVVDLDAEGNEATLERWQQLRWSSHRFSAPSYIILDGGKSVIQQYLDAATWEEWEGDMELALRQRDGSKTTLLKGNGLKGEDASVPRFAAKLDRRYFLYEWSNSGGFGVYDTQALKNYPIQFPRNNDHYSVLAQSGDYVYFGDHSFDEQQRSQMRLLRLDWTSVKQEKTPALVDLLEGVNTEDVGENYALSPDGGFFVSYTPDALQVFDLRSEAIKSSRIPVPAIRLPVLAFYDENTLYFYGGHAEDREVLEVTFGLALPPKPLPVPAGSQLHDLGEGITWQLFDLIDPKNKAKQDIIADVWNKNDFYYDDADKGDREEGDPAIYSMGDGKKLVARFITDDDYHSEIVVQDAKGKETVTHKATVRYDPWVRGKLSERSFVYYYGVFGSSVPPTDFGIYDTQAMKDYRIVFPYRDNGFSLWRRNGDDLYFSNWDGFSGDPYLERLYLVRINWRDVERGVTPIAVDLLEAMPGLKEINAYYRALSWDYKWFVVLADEGLMLFDISGSEPKFWLIPTPKEMLTPDEELPKYNILTFIDDHTLYWYSHHYTDRYPNLIEITLP